MLTNSAYDLNTPGSGVQEGNGLGELVADAFLWAVSKLEGGLRREPPVTVTADGVLRAPLYAGPITTSQAFDVLSMGVGTDGTSGYPLVSCYLTGKGTEGGAGGRCLGDASLCPRPSSICPVCSIPSTPTGCFSTG